MKPPKELFYPIKPWLITQEFGKNNVPFYKQDGKKGHSGIDIVAKHGQKVFASHDGKCFPQVDDHGGNGVVLWSDNDYYTIYWHLIDDDAVVHTGQEVKAGDLIGYADNTGQSTGDHLHFGLHIIGEDLKNGYNGFTDPQPYLNGKYAEEIQTPVIVPKYSFTRTLKIKDWNKDVRELQTLLKAQNLYSGAVDGVFGNITLLAVKSFQNIHHLVSDGVVGKKTNAELNKLLNI